MRKPYLLRKCLVKYRLFRAMGTLENNSEATRNHWQHALEHAKGDDALTEEAIRTGCGLMPCLAKTSPGEGIFLACDVLEAAKGNERHTTQALVGCTIALSNLYQTNPQLATHGLIAELVLRMIDAAGNNALHLTVLHHGFCNAARSAAAKDDSINSRIAELGVDLIQKTTRNEKLAGKALAFCKKSILPQLIDNDPSGAAALCRIICSASREIKKNLPEVFALCASTTSALTGKGAAWYAVDVADSALSLSESSGKTIPGAELEPYANLACKLVNTVGQYPSQDPGLGETITTLVNRISEAAGRNEKDVFCREFQINGNTLTIHTADAPGPASGGLSVPSFPELVKSWPPAPG